MTVSTWPQALAFVWRPGFDNPADGYHETPGDPGAGTKGGVIEATWRDALARGVVRGALRDADNAALAAVLRIMFWGPACDALPAGVDLVLFNGRMMSGAFPKILQRCLGMTGSAVDGAIGPATIAAAHRADPATLISAAIGVHDGYLRDLPTWSLFGNGWETRLAALRVEALGLAARLA